MIESIRVEILPHASDNIYFLSPDELIMLIGIHIKSTSP